MAGSFTATIGASSKDLVGFTNVTMIRCGRVATSMLSTDAVYRVVVWEGQADRRTDERTDKCSSFMRLVKGINCGS